MPFFIQNLEIHKINKFAMALKLNLNCILYVYIYSSISYKQDLNLGASEAEADLFLYPAYSFSPSEPPYLAVPPVCSSIQTVLMLVRPWWTKKIKNENAHFHSNTVFLRPGVIESECITFLFCFVYMKINE